LGQVKFLKRLPARSSKTKGFRSAGTPFYALVTQKQPIPYLAYL